jgi:hypothetical protein
MNEYRIVIALLFCALLFSTLFEVVIVQTDRPEILAISPTSGPEGSRVLITGKSLENASGVLFGRTDSAFTLISPTEIVALIPHKSITSAITVVSPIGRALSPFAFVVTNDPRVPEEVSYKAGYVNPIRPPADFRSAAVGNRHRGYSDHWIRIGENRNCFDAAHLPCRWQERNPERRHRCRSRWTLLARPVVCYRSTRPHADDP